MERRLIRAGDDQIIALPQDLLDFLNLSDGAEVSLEFDQEHQRIMIQPIGQPLAELGIDEAFVKKVDAFIERYRPALEALAQK